MYTAWIKQAKQHFIGLIAVMDCYTLHMDSEGVYPGAALANILRALWKLEEFPQARVKMFVKHQRSRQGV